MDPLRGLDLASLPVLADLLHTHSTTVTAQRLGQTQSAVSHSLARLRTHLGDPLLVRVGRRLSPTKFAEDLAPRLEAALGQLRDVFQAGDQFSAGDLERTFTLAGTDFSELLLLPSTMARLAKEAPKVDVVCRALGSEVERAIQEGDVDVAFGTLFRDRAGIVTKKVAEDRLVVLLRKDHPARAKLTLSTYVGLKHVLVAPRGTAGGAIDDELARTGLTRRVALRVGHFTTAVALVAESDLVVTLPRSFAVAMTARHPVVIRDAPVALPPFAFSLAWNERRTKDRAHQYFRDVLTAAAKGAFAQASR